jgi:ABC-2 type transport system ATP-binding protein
MNETGATLPSAYSAEAAGAASAAKAGSEAPSLRSTSLAILTQNLTRRFGRLRALDEVNAHIPKGAIYGLMGPNGAGKTTFVRVLLNLVNPTSGSATVLGYDVVREPVKVRQRVGHVAALQPLWDWMTVRDFAGFMRGCYPRWNSEAVSTVLDRIGIDQAATLGVLSRGQRAVVAIAVAVGHEPDLLILDEALTGLDPIARREVLRNVIDAMQAEGRTVLITGQDIADMERICDHVGFLVKGRLVLEATLDDLKARVKRIRVEHPGEAEVLVPAGAFQIERRPRETVFTVENYAEALLSSLDGPGRRVSAANLSLEDIFIDLAQAHMKGQDMAGAGGKLPPNVPGHGQEQAPAEQL